MKKQCYQCNQELPLSSFNKNCKKKDGLQSECRDCGKTYRKQHYQDNKQYYIDKAVKRRDNNVKKLTPLLVEYLEQNPCVDCGNNDIRVLHFDHLENKQYHVPEMIRLGHSWQNILSEISKCDVRCANCHAIKTWPNRFDT